MASIDTRFSLKYSTLMPNAQVPVRLPYLKYFWTSDPCFLDSQIPNTQKVSDNFFASVALNFQSKDILGNDINNLCAC